MSEFKTIGQPKPLLEGREKVTGASRYVGDLGIPGLCHARFVTSQYAHAVIKGIEKSAALEVPGVVAVLTSADLPQIVPSSRGKLLLARDKVIFNGQPVALVIAETEAAAQDGAEIVFVDYEPLPAVVTIDDALAEDSPLVWPNGIPTGAEDAAAHGADTESDSGGEKSRKFTNVASSTEITRGDVAAAFNASDVIVERTFETPMVHQNYLETQSVTVQPDFVTGGAVVWVSTQAAFDVRRSVADALGVPESDVRVIGTTVGGAFGGKFGLYEPLVALAARAVGRSVRLIMTRSEEFFASAPAPAMRIQARVGATTDGTLTAVEADVVLDAGCYPMNFVAFAGNMLVNYYPVENFSVQSREVLTNKPSVGAYRAPLVPAIVFVIDTLVDEIARHLGLDTIEMRLKNLADPGDPLANGQPWPNMAMRQTLETLRDHPAWQNRERARQQGHGVGVAVGGWFGGMEPAAATCGLNRDGLIHVHVGSSDISGTLTGFALIAAEAFGVSPDKVRMITSDTQTAPYSGGAGGSKITYSTGTAVMKAAEAARQQVLAIAAEEFEAAVEDLEIVDGAVRVRGIPSNAITLGDLASRTMRFGGKYPPVYAHGNSSITDRSPAFCAQLAEVSVDRETGHVRLHRLVVIQDVGRAINPLAIEGQMMGGATQGTGWALHEGITYDESGQLLSGTWMDYDIPDFTQAAEQIETVIIEVPSDHGPFGVRGVGEPPVIPTAAAIANAIADGAGIRLSKLPMSPKDVWAALQSL